jgi:hypothetical protein
MRCSSYAKVFKIGFDRVNGVLLGTLPLVTYGVELVL